MADTKQTKTPEQQKAEREEQVRKYSLGPNEYFFQVKEFARSEAGGFIYSGSRVTRIVIGQTVVVDADGTFRGPNRELLPDQSWWGIRLNEANRDLQKLLEESTKKGVRVPN